MTKEQIEQELAELEQRRQTFTFELGAITGKMETLRRFLPAATPAPEPPAEAAGPLGLVEGTT